jgi:putative ABC transport system ATP-binding protein
MTTPVIEFQNIHRHYEMGGETVLALDGVNLQITDGEMVAVMGPSGSGKSTLMNVVGLLDRPTEGVFLLDGIDVSSLSDDERSRARGCRIGFVFQGFNLLPRMTALSNVELPLRLNPKGQNRKEAAIAALTRVGLADRAGHKPSELSGGQQQRVAIARALANQPSLVLADEPTGNLDSTSTRAIIGLLQDLNLTDGITVVVVTHENEVAEACKRVVALEDGKVVEDRPTLQKILEPDDIDDAVGVTA